MLAGIDPIIAATLLLIVAVTALLWIKNRPVSAVCKRPLFSPSERAFLGQLDMAVRSHLIVFPYVPVQAVFKAKRLSRGKSLLRSLSSHSIDYVICNRKDMSVVCAITLNNNNKHSSKRQGILRKLCQSAGVPLLEYEEKPYRNVPSLRRQIFAVSGIDDSDLSSSGQATIQTATRETELPQLHEFNS